MLVYPTTDILMTEILKGKTYYSLRP